MVVSVGDVGPGLSVVCQVRRTTTYVLTGSWVDLTFDTLDLETDAAQIEHDFGGAGTGRIYVKAAGDYEVSIQGIIDVAGAPVSGIGFSLYVNGSPHSGGAGGAENIAGSTSDRRGFGVDYNVTLAAGDYLHWRVTQSGASATVRTNALFTVRRYTGAIGADGADGDITWEGAWVSQNYVINQAVSYLGSSYVCKVNTVSSEVPTNATYWDTLALKGDTGDAGAPNVPLVQARQTATTTPGAGWADVPFDVTDVENAPGEIKHDDTLTDRIYVYTDGVYELRVDGSIFMTTASDQIQMRFRIDDTTIVPGALLQRVDTTGGVARSFSRSVLVSLTAGQWISFMTVRIGTSGSIYPDLTFSVRRYVGIEGPTGDTGSTGPAGDATPTADTLGWNTEGISADKTLVDGDEVIQTLTPSVAGLSVILPTITVDTPFFRIINPWTSSYAFTVKTSNGVNLILCPVGNQILIFTNGVTAFAQAVSVPPSAVALAPLHFSAFGWVANRYVFAGRNDSGVGTDSSLNYQTQYVVPVTGSIDYLTWEKQYVSTTADIKIVINGTPGGATYDVKAINGVAAISIAVTAGDRIAIQTITGGGNWGQAQYTLWLTPTTGGALVRPFGANLSTLNYYYYSGGFYGSLQQVLPNAETDYTIPEACALLAVGHTTNASLSTAQLAVWKNGILSETKAFAAGTSGLITGFTTTFAAGDTMSLQNTTQITSSATLLAAFDGNARSPFCFNGDNNTKDRFLTTLASAQDTGDGDGLPWYLWAHRMPAAGYAYGITIQSDADATNSYQLQKNGVAVASFDVTTIGGVAVVVFDTMVAFAANDRIALYTTTGSSFTLGQFEIMFFIL